MIATREDQTRVPRPTGIANEDRSRRGGEYYGAVILLRQSPPEAWMLMQTSVGHSWHGAFMADSTLGKRKQLNEIIEKMELWLGNRDLVQLLVV